ncbi:MAG: DUF6677 family protein, partial [Phycisphaerales bacterium]
STPVASAARQEPEEFQPLAALLAFALPGLGHWYLGERRRAVYVCIGVLGLFFGGVFIGGISVVDSGLVYHNWVKGLISKVTKSKPTVEQADGDPIWFLGQAMVGPVALATDYIHQFHFKVRESVNINGETRVIYKTALPNQYRDPASGEARTITDAATQSPPYIKALGRPAELGTLFSTIAGMLNLMCVIDAGFNRRRRGGA